MAALFPRTAVAGVSMPRMLIGPNWLFGYSHTGRAADEMIKHKYGDVRSYLPVISAFLKHGIDALMGPVSAHPLMPDALKIVKDELGKDIILIDTPVMNVDDNQAAREETRRIIKKSADTGATFCLIHHSSAEQLVNKNKGTIERLGDYTDMIRQAGLIPGLSAHMPELILYSDKNGYDIETYIQIYNCAGFLMQIEIETVASIIHKAKKPVMTIKPMAAGRVTPFVGLNFVWNTIRECDMVTVGCFNENEALEDIEISYAALERRLPNLEGRSSPNSNQAVLAK